MKTPVQPGQTPKYYRTPVAEILPIAAESLFLVGSREGLGDLDNPPAWDEED